MKKTTKQLSKNLLVSILIFVALAVLLSAYSLPGNKPEEVSLSQVVAAVNEDRVKAISVKHDKLTVELTDGTEQVSYKEPGESLSTLLDNYDVDAAKMASVRVEIKQDSGLVVFLGNVLPFLLPLLLVGVFVWLMMRQVQGANNRAAGFGQSGARETSPKDGKNRVTFKDIAGNAEAKNELDEVVEFLKTPKKFAAIGAKIPKGVLLMGSPGTGKTLLARAVAGEAGVPFFHISGSEFVEMFVGVGASRVRDLFAKAKKQAPCIVFIDEIDAVGRQRGAGLGGSHDEREQTLNQILVEMDGFDPNSGVIVLAATNRPDVLDPALLRPGRFDRRVVLDQPDVADREAILSIHAANKPLAEDVNLKLIAQRTPGFSGADLANLFNEAAILAARRDKQRVGQAELIESIEKVMLGPERKSRAVSDEERRVTAYHEAGHAVVAHLLPAADPVHKISIISRGMAAGYTLKIPNDDRRMHRLSEFLADIAVAMGGRVAEVEFFGRDNLTTGASSDLKKATAMAKQMVTNYGMSEDLAPRTYGENQEMIFLGREIHHQRDYSEKVAEKLDAEIGRLVSDGEATARKIIREHRPVMDRIAAVLLERETIEKDEFEQIMKEATGIEKK
jgi:cell division protease FtsH